MTTSRPRVGRETTEFFRRRYIQLIPQAPYSPDLNQLDRWMFKEQKSGLRLQSYKSATKIFDESLRIMRSIPKERYAYELNVLYDHCKAVMQSGGDNITK